MARYVLPGLTSIITALFAAAFALQVNGDRETPTGQWVAMAFLLIALIWLWTESITQWRFAAAETLRGRSSVRHSVIWAHSIFPLIAWLIAIFAATLYFAAFNWIDPPGADSLRRALPTGFFIPSIIWVVVFGGLFAITAVNKTANNHTSQQQTIHDQRTENKQQLAGQVALLRAAVVDPDTEQLRLLGQISSKAGALPLIINSASAPVVARLGGELHQLAENGRSPSTEELKRVLGLINQIR
jgi:hypothetical protein